MKSQPVKLTQSILSSYLEGQIEILRGRGKILYRGKINDIKLEKDGDITIILIWIARGESHMVPGRWTKEVPQSPYSIRRNHVATNIGPRIHGDGDRIEINTGLHDAIFTLFPPDETIINLT